ncbi:MAG: F0F1 ATP synthase subunit A [Ignavibacteria bacterium]
MIKILDPKPSVRKTLLKILPVFIIFFSTLFTLYISTSYAQEHKDETTKQDIHTADDEGNFDIIERVVDHHYVDLYFFGKLNLPHFAPVNIGGMEIDFSVTKSLFMMIISSILLVIVLAFAASKNAKNRVPRGIGNMVESIVVFIRDEIVVPNMGKAGIKMLPFFCSLFFFIMFANLIGLFPFMAQPTKNINITAALALITFSVTQVKGIQAHGVVGYFKGLVPPGVPVFVMPIMIVVEFIGLFTKPFSLLMRLFANITAGSIIIFSLIGLIFIMSYAGTIIAIPLGLFIYMLEIFIALLQAYIFTMLSVLYIDMAVHQH